MSEIKNDDAVDIEVNTESLSPEQEIGALRKVHEFLGDFDRVPGSMSAAWSQMLDTVAVVANSLISKLPEDVRNQAVAEPAIENDDESEVK